MQAFPVDMPKEDKVVDDELKGLAKEFIEDRVQGKDDPDLTNKLAQKVEGLFGFGSKKQSDDDDGRKSNRNRDDDDGDDNDSDNDKEDQDDSDKDDDSDD